MTHSDTVNLAVIAVLTSGLLVFGFLGIKNRGKKFKRKDLSDAHFTLSIGEFGTGLMLLGYLLYVFWNR